MPKKEPNEFDQNRDVARCHLFERRPIESLGSAQLQVIDPLVPKSFEFGLQGRGQDTDRRQPSELAANVGTFCLPRAEFDTSNEP